jgi:putative MATE family efflux protein
MNRTAPLTEGPIATSLVRLAGPIIASNLLQTAYQATDTFWVGRLSEQAVAAVSLCFPINFLLIALGGGLLIAGTVLIAQYKGRGDQAAMDHVATQTCIMVAIVSVILAGGGYLLSEPIMRFMGAAPDVLPDAVRFLKMTFIGFVFVFGFFIFQTLMRGLGVVITPLLIVLVTVLLNFALDPFLIFGYGPIPAMGVAGAAAATVCTQALAAIIGFVILFRGSHGIKLNWRGFRPDFPLIGRMLRIGIPASVEQSTRALGLTVMTLLVSQFGTVIVAAYGIGMRVLSFVFVPALGLSMATSTLVGQNIGAGKLERAERTTWIAIAIGFISLSCVGTILYFTADPLARFIVPQAGPAIPVSAEFIRTLAFTFGFIGMQQVVTGTLRGAGDTLAAMVVAIISLWVLQFPLAYTLSQHTRLGARGIWMAIAIANVISAVFTVAWLLNGRWKKRLVLADVDLEKRVSDELAIDEGMAS